MRLRKGPSKNPLKTNFWSPQASQNPSKIEEKYLKIVVKTMFKKTLEKSANLDPLEKPVLARNGKRENILE